jgi:RNA polymerase sigma-70 factor (family 1)
MNCLLSHIQDDIALGNEKAFAELYKLFNNKLKHFAKAITRSNELAEEVVEDVFVKLWCNRQNITSINTLTVYLYIAVKNRSLNHVSQKAKELITAPFDDLDIEIGNVAANPYDLLVTAEMMQQMQQAIDELPPRCKMIFKLVREDGLKYKEVAAILNISVNTIDVQMAIAVKKICTALQVSKPNATVFQFKHDEWAVGKK